MYIKEIAVFLVVFLAAKYFWRKRRFFYLASKIPRSNFDFSWKGIYEFLTADSKKIFEQIYGSVKGMDGIAKTWLGPVLFVIANDPEDVKIIWNSKECYDKPYFVKFPGIYEGSLFGSIHAWQTHRKILDPYFGNQKLKNFLPIFDEKSKVLTRKVGEMLGKGEFDVFHYMTALTLETILNAMELNVDIQNLEVKVRDLTIKGLERASKVVTKRIVSFWLHPDFIYKRTKYFVAEMKAKSHSAFTYVDDVIENIRQNIDSGEEVNIKPTSFMRALLDSKHDLPREEIVDEIRTLLIAVNTSALAMSSSLLLLAMHKDAQNKIIAELHDVLGKSPNAPFIDFEKLSQLQYTEMVINETMRLMPVVPFVARRVENEVAVTKGYIIPADANVFVPIYGIHRNKSIWGEDADQFRPERFEKENFQKIHPYAFIPFTKGPRMCLGYRYAMALMKVQLANFLMQYEVDTSLKYEELEFELNITLNVCQGLRISIKERK
ncbi:unnamed protein product [Chironomus riparius]|uniref:Cytochrome P450 n=1 Tax=Chironomus riparius TaxID=315576 RepID=A0A9N9WUK6_9DIPT|nr:unnamed protein product [Chironomus riparius]